MEFRLLGPVEVWDGAERVPLGGPKPRALLASLLLSPGRVVSVDRLVDLIWSDRAPGTARDLIQTYVSALRRRLRPEVIVTRPPGYLLRLDGERFDLQVFEQLVADGRLAAEAGRYEDAEQALRAAAGLWRGPALGGIGEALQAEAARLEELRLAAVEERIAAELLLDRHGDLVAELTALVAAHPTRERIRGQLMTTLYRLGRSAEALAVFDEGRVRLAEELGLDPGPELRALQEAVLRGDPSLSGAAPPYLRRQFVAKQLPPDVPDFTGRADVVGELTKLLSASRTAPPVVIVSGKGGVGKSAVTVHVAHRVAERFPDGQLFADLRGTSDTPATDQEVLGRFLRALGVEHEAQPESAAERADLYRSLLAQRQVLVVLDDARSEQQIRPLLPGEAGCAVLVTSRGRLAGLAGAQLVDLDMLDGDAALALFGAVAGADRVAAEPEAAREIVRLCGLLPLAVRTVGARLATRRHWALATMAVRLTDERRRLDELTAGDVEVRASVSLSYRLLDEQARTAFRRLGLLGVPDFAPWIIAPLLDVPAADADDVAERLVDAQLVDFTAIDATGQPRYRLHDLLRVFAAECAETDDTAAERAAAVTRTLGSWLWLVDTIGARTPSGEVVLRGGYASARPVDGLVAERAAADPAAWLDAEAPGLTVAVSRAAAMNLDVAACDLAAALSFSHVFDANRRGEWHASHQAALAAARRAGNRSGEALLLAGLGHIHYRLDRFDEVHEYLSAALPLFAATGDVRGEAVALAGMGGACREQCRMREGLGYLTRSTAIFRGLGDHTAIGATSRMAAAIHLELGAYEAAWPLLDQALEAYRRVGSRRGEALTLRTTSLVHRALGDYAVAAGLSAQALELFRAIGDSHLAAFAVQSLVKARIRQGDGAGLPLLVDALEVCRNHFDRFGEALLQRTIGELHLANGQLDLAEAHLLRSIAISEELRTPLPVARAKRDLAAVLAARGDGAVAELVIAEAAAVFARHGAREAGELKAVTYGQSEGPDPGKGPALRSPA
ncbi:tetratricopeptide repeat protein [Nonomuraea sp. PA05]|uniref:AfsR/SARP family transcriptional regulator n=1 Tax=Nonomuraea sp. PA05 TaxID=2604466 RepID=UPI0011D8DEEA|nr:AfsR/SARP family transcriptional regulator [Nonomuraea sp. PA05]TYB64830.1 tetratricopeptide repeat protein [Nonomuraea sp. PA05]